MIAKTKKIATRKKTPATPQEFVVEIEKLVEAVGNEVTQKIIAKNTELEAQNAELRQDRAATARDLMIEKMDLMARCMKIDQRIEALGFNSDSIRAVFEEFV